MDAFSTQNPQQALLDCLTIFANPLAGRNALEGVEMARSEVLLRENLPAYATV